MSAPPEPSRHRHPRVRRVPPRGLRLLLPQRDRSPARRARRDPRGDDGRVRHRVRRRHRLAPLGRAQRQGPDPHRRARAPAGRGSG
ncbi:hypothetical protein [Nocardioides convexus]|uniref:hypothetical protein n=1 Tax=Nocardioides convexus TaxID=2712224 RepID=UPI0024183565|nr:hypothetical protein [Nocardioides convexus]